MTNMPTNIPEDDDGDDFFKQILMRHYQKGVLLRYLIKGVFELWKTTGNPALEPMIANIKDFMENRYATDLNKTELWKPLEDRDGTIT